VPIVPAHEIPRAKLHQHWNLSKSARHSPSGVVVAASPPAAEIGARVLAEGGNAIDAAIATGLALHVTEPWSSGLGGGGFMLVYLAATRQVHAINFSMKSALDTRIDDYKLVPGGKRSGPFQWPQVVDDRHSFGWGSIMIPGAVDGFGLALERFGSWSWARVLDPVIALAERGWTVGWYTTTAIASEARGLAAFPGSRDVFLRHGHYPPTVEGDDGADLIRDPKMPAFLKRLAKEGPRDIYEGALARDLVADMAEGGRQWTLAELKAYRARIREPLTRAYRGHTLIAAPDLNGGPTVLRFFEHYEAAHRAGAGRPRPADYAALAQHMRARWEERYEAMGDTGSGDRCTTHLNVVDRAGNMVALTNTLGARFGSKVSLNRLGLLMNNGVFWFDPEPGKPNSIGPGKWPLTNACPMMAARGDRVWYAAGASGGRRVPPMMIQLASFLIDHGLSLQEAFHVPRLDPVRLEAVSCDHRMRAEEIAAVAAVAPVRVTENATYPMMFAVPSAVARDLDRGINSGMASIDVPYSLALAEEDVRA
jgi:gamma-glutamyltranspeptidase/glutathione hydrolase